MSDKVPDTLVRRQLKHMLESRLFIAADRLAVLLIEIVLGTLSAKPPTEDQLGIWVFGWEPGSYKHDASIRIYLGRLRKRLGEYYRTDGRNDLVRIDIAGRSAIFKYNHESPFMPRFPLSLTSDFTATLQNHFVDRFEGDLRCIVTSEPADWHHLDGDPCNNAIGNLVPLSERLRNNLDGLRAGRKEDRLQEISPAYLSNLAALHHKHWRTAAAYGCAHLAFHMGEDPFGKNPTISECCACVTPCTTPDMPLTIRLLPTSSAIA